ncbi:MAG TPA: hypothetical protein DEU95_06290 [Chloroflexi bacterium]|jgi:hypothetical protein|nr:hypothetical protein [Chloroflexota bacterium]HCG29345.1 hypothetical protein [Chloroflexota bacterium]
MSVMMPDYAAAVVAHLRAQSAVLAFAPSARIAMHIPDSADMPENWIIVSPAGGRGPIGRSPYLSARLDVMTYGVTGYEAMRGARIVAGVLTPPGRSTRIRQLDCVIAEVAMEAGFIRLQTPREGWPYVATPYALTVLREAVPA